MFLGKQVGRIDIPNNIFLFKNWFSHFFFNQKRKYKKGLIFRFRIPRLWFATLKQLISTEKWRFATALKNKRSQIRVNDMIKKKCTFFFQNLFSFLSFFVAHLSLLDCLVSDIRNYFHQYFYKLPIKRTGWCFLAKCTVRAQVFVFFQFILWKVWGDLKIH